MAGLRCLGVALVGLVLSQTAVAASLTGGNVEDLWPVATNAQASALIQADQLQADLGLTGLGVTVGVWDDGLIRGSHQEFQAGGGGSRVSIGPDLSTPPLLVTDHATHVAGTIGASGVDPLARGVAPGVSLVSFTSGQFTGELRDNAGNLDLSNHSYAQTTGWYSSGGAWYWDGVRTTSTEPQAFGKYTATSQWIDWVMATNPHHLAVWAAGNEIGEGPATLTGTYYARSSPTSGFVAFDTADYPAPPRDGLADGGFDSLTPYQTTKNTVIVGALADDGVSLLSNSSRGPTDDGRLGVTVVANGAGVYSPEAASDSDYGARWGTSQAAPSVTGVAALLTEHYDNLFGGRPLSSTTKGLLAHTADDLGNVGPDYSYGFGRVDAAAAADFLSAAALFPAGRDWLVEGSIREGEEWVQKLHADGAGPLKATLAWTDPYPVTLTDRWSLDDPLSMLVNDLDLWISDTLGNIYYPWVLDPAAPATPATRAVTNGLGYDPTLQNSRDNSNQVLIDLPAPGDYFLHIGESRMDDPLSDSQDFSLLVSGASPVPEPNTLTASAVALLLLGRSAWRRRRRVDRG